MSTKLLLVRHGEVEGIEPERFRGRRDLPLTARGVAQAGAVARQIAAHHRPAAIYASPLSRTIATAEAIAKPFNLPIERAPELIDIDYGEWHGLSAAQARTRWPDQVDLWYREPDRVQIPEGESLTGVLARVAPVLEGIARRHDGGLVVIVAHESVNRVILLHALGAPLSSYWRIGQKPCCINEIDVRGGDSFLVVRMNDTAHLETLEHA